MIFLSSEIQFQPVFVTLPEHESTKNRESRLRSRIRFQTACMDCIPYDDRMFFCCFLRPFGKTDQKPIQRASKLLLPVESGRKTTCLSRGNIIRIRTGKAKRSAEDLWPVPIECLIVPERLLSMKSAHRKIRQDESLRGRYQKPAERVWLSVRFRCVTEPGKRDRFHDQRLDRFIIIEIVGIDQRDSIFLKLNGVCEHAFVHPEHHFIQII